MSSNPTKPTESTTGSTGAAVLSKFISRNNPDPTARNLPSVFNTRTPSGRDAAMHVSCCLIKLYCRCSPLSAVPLCPSASSLGFAELVRSTVCSAMPWIDVNMLRYVLGDGHTTDIGTILRHHRCRDYAAIVPVWELHDCVSLANGR